MNTHPQIFKLKEIYKNEKDSFRKTHRLIDLFESIIKTYTAIIMAEYFSRNNYSNPVKKLLAEGLRTPSLGTWQLFSRVLLNELIEQKHSFFIKSLPADFKALDKSIQQRRTNIIALRNEYAHGATPDNQRCKNDAKQFEPFLNDILSTSWLKETDIIEKDGIVLLKDISTAKYLTLHPIIIFKPEKDGPPFCFFNDLKNYKMGLLNYPLSKKYRDKQLYEELQVMLPLEKWKKTQDNTFKKELSYLTESFKGRLSERKKIKEFIMDKSKGFLTITGNPGIGKSALMAQVINETKNDPACKHCCFFEYFIHKGTIYADPLYMLSYLIQQVEKQSEKKQLLNLATKSVQSLFEIFLMQLRQISNNDRKRKFVFFIDGLDEGAESGILTYLPKEVLGNIQFVLGTRKGGYVDVEKYLTELPLAEHSKLELKGLNDADIRSLLYDVISKYEIEAKWVENIRLNSEGNPLYLKLFCQALQEGEIQVNESKLLFRKTEDFYNSIVQRYAKNEDGEIILNALFIFAAAKDYLTIDHIGEINGLEIKEKHMVASVLLEVLNENTMNTEVMEYQIFHETFRTFLFKHYRIEIKKAANRLIQFCSKWNEYSGIWEQKYALEHYASHLLEAEGGHFGDTLQNLADDAIYKHTQTQTLHHYHATNNLLVCALENSINNSSNDNAIKNAFHMLTLHASEKSGSNEILQMVTDNTIDRALRRISSMSEKDKHDISEIYSIYVLSLMELTHLNKKSDKYKKDACTLIIEHLTNNPCFNRTPLNSSGSQVSGYLVFLIAVELGKMEISHTILFQKLVEIGSSERWDWISELTELSEYQICIIRDAVQCEIHSPTLNDAKGILALKQFSVGWQQEAIETLKTIKDPERQIFGFLDLAFETGLKKNDPKQHYLLNEAVSILEDLLSSDNKADIDDYLVVKVSEKLSENYYFSEAYKALLKYKGDHRDDCFNDLCVKLIENGELELATIAIEENANIDSDENTQNLMVGIAKGFAQQGNFQKAESLALKIKDDYKRDETIAVVIIESVKTNGLNNNIYYLIRKLSEYNQEETYYSIINTLCELDQSDQIESIKFSENLLEVYSYDEILEKAITKLLEINKPRNAFELLGKIEQGFIKERNSAELFTALLEHNYLDEAKKCLYQIEDVFEQSKMLAQLSTAYYNIGDQKAAKNIWDEIEALSEEADFTDPLRIFNVISFLSITSIELNRQGLIEDSQEAINGAIDFFYEVITMNVDYWTFQITIKDFIDALNHLCKEEILNDITEKTLNGQLSQISIWDILDIFTSKGIYSRAYNLLCDNSNQMFSNDNNVAKPERIPSRYRVSVENLITWFVKNNEIDKTKKLLSIIKEEGLVALAIDICLDDRLFDNAISLTKMHTEQEDKFWNLKKNTLDIGLFEKDNRVEFYQRITTNLFEEGYHSKVMELVSDENVFEESFLINLAENFINIEQYEYAANVLFIVNNDYFRKKDLLREIICKENVKESLLDEIAKDYFKTIAGLPDQLVLEKQFFESIAVSFANQLSLKNALNYLNRIQDPFLKTRTLQKISLGLTKRKALYEVYSLLLESLSEGQSQSIFNFEEKYFETLSIDLAEEGHFYLSVNTTDLIKTPIRKANCLINILGVVLKRKHKETATFIINKTIKEVEKIKTGYEKESILRSLAVLAIENNLFEHLPEIIECLCYKGIDSEKYLEMYDLLVEKNRLDLALMIISGLFICNNSTVAFSILNNMNEYENRLKLLLPNNHLQLIKDCLPESRILEKFGEDVTIFQRNLLQKEFPVEFTAMLYYALMSKGLFKESENIAKSIEGIDSNEKKAEQFATLAKISALLTSDFQPKSLIEKSIMYANSCESQKSKVASLIAIFRICGPEAVTDKAMNILNTALSEFDLKNEKLFLYGDQISDLTAISTAYFYAGDNKKSDEIIKLIQDKFISNFVDQKKLLNQLFDQKKYLKALEFAQIINNKELILRSLIKLGKYDEAMSIFSSLETNSFAYETEAKFFILNLLKDKIFDSALVVAKKQKDKDIYYRAVAYIAIEFVRESDYKKVCETLGLLKGNDDALMLFIRKSLELKEFVFAMHAYDMITNKSCFNNGNLEGSRSELFRKLLNALLQQDSKELFVQFMINQKDIDGLFPVIKGCFSKIPVKYAHNRIIEYAKIIPDADLQGKFLESAWMSLFEKDSYYECNDILALYPGLVGKGFYFAECIIIVWIKLGRFNDAVNYIFYDENLLNDNFTKKRLIEKLANEIFKKDGLKSTLSWLTKLEHESEKNDFLKAIVRAINPGKATKEEVCQLIGLIKQDYSAINQLMLSYVLHQIFFANKPEPEMDKYKVIYDLDWAFKVRELSANNKKPEKSALNIESWIHEITDEYDQADVVLWAERVKKGEITDEKFMNRVNKLFS